jgi:protein-glutamine gamma-glutamyltransferase
MITVGSQPVSTTPVFDGFVPDTLQSEILKTLMSSSYNYRYESLDHLAAELKIRGSIVTAARDLAHSGFRFRVFRDSMANPDFWRRTPEGGLALRGDMLPSAAILDIYRNGSKYGSECATAMIIVLYKAILDVMPAETFNKLYADIYLMNWKHVDRDLALIMKDEAADLLPGDAKYFMNPDVDSLTPEWQGENVFYLGGGRYYGHGIGIEDADSIIRSLNGNRRDGATRTAYLDDSVKRQDYLFLSQYIKKPGTAGRMG